MSLPKTQSKVQTLSDRNKNQAGATAHPPIASEMVMKESSEYCNYNLHSEVTTIILGVFKTIGVKGEPTCRYIFETVVPRAMTYPELYGLLGGVGLLQKRVFALPYYQRRLIS